MLGLKLIRHSARQLAPSRRTSRPLTKRGQLNKELVYTRNSRRCAIRTRNYSGLSPIDDESWASKTKSVLAEYRSRGWKRNAIDLWDWTVDAVVHILDGFRKLGNNIFVAYFLLTRSRHGKKLRKADTNVLKKTGTDLLKTIPFTVITLIPFAEAALPILLKLFPTMLPSTLSSTHETVCFFGMGM